LPRSHLAPLSAVIDIGSNSVRMVVFSSAERSPVPIYNERTLCGLGRSLGETGKLDAEGVVKALAHLARFAALARAMGVERIEALATEAVRAASDGADFVAEAESILGASINILKGESEAQASAYGVVSGIPGADGMMGDLGGGSLEIVTLDKGIPGAYATLPIGSLRLQEAAGTDIVKAGALVDKAFERVEWLGAIRGRTFYPVGGAWRAFAAVHMNQQNYPLHVVHQYSMSRIDAVALLQLISCMSLKSLAKIRGVPKARLKTLPVAAIVLERLLSKARPKELVFSAYGLREGWLYCKLDETEKAQDPLLTGAAVIAARESRFAMPGEELDQWVSPLFADENPQRVRLRRAAVLLCDIAWRDHPDYRARDSFARILHLPLSAITHAERVILAYMVSASYGGGRTGPTRSLVKPLISEDDLDYAMTVGRALRFARNLAAGTVEILRTTRLKMDQDYLTVQLPKGMEHLMSDEITRRFDALARRLKRKPKIQT
jgi:exopolyphosphatase/guanosine-5'-triphosphate,3'-diphosphate pyrophosphatase